MTLTLLFDLDNTLLDNEMDTFVPAYLKMLAFHLRDYLNPSELAPVMLAATEEMFKNTQIDRTLKAAFDPHFYPALGLSETQIRPEIDRFYAEVYPALQDVTAPRPQVPALIAEIERRGWRVVIATNPLFPKIAIRHRLAWAGLPVEQHNFAIVPSYDRFHFAKPDSAFFAELLGQIGWPDGPILMVGNDPDHDIRGASQLGLATFWIANGQPYPEGFPAPTASGELDDLLPWLDSVPEDTLLPDCQSSGAIRITLRGIPAAWDTLTTGIPPETWSRPAVSGEWNLTEIVCHLRDVEREITLPRFRKILAEENPRLLEADPDPWAEERDYRSQDGPTALRDFLAARKQTLSLLAALSDHDWQRPAQHAVLGPVTLRDLASFSARHDRMHIRQAYGRIVNG